DVEAQHAAVRGTHRDHAFAHARRREHLDARRLAPLLLARGRVEHDQLAAHVDHRDVAAVAADTGRQAAVDVAAPAYLAVAVDARDRAAGTGGVDRAVHDLRLEQVAVTAADADTPQRAQLGLGLEARRLGRL